MPNDVSRKGFPQACAERFGSFSRVCQIGGKLPDRLPGLFDPDVERLIVQFESNAYRASDHYTIRPCRSCLPELIIWLARSRTASGSNPAILQTNRKSGSLPVSRSEEHTSELQS